MDLILRSLIERLVEKGLQIDCIPAYVRDLLHEVTGCRDIVLDSLNSRLQSLGWSKFDLDDCTLKLALTTLETDRPNPGKPTYFLPLKLIVSSDELSGINGYACQPGEEVCYESEIHTRSQEGE